MARKSRDYAAEYRRRLQRAKVFGYSKSVARGHAKKGEQPASKRKRQPTLEAKWKEFVRVDDEIIQDAKKVFGRVPKRTKQHPLPIDYETYLGQLQKREGQFDWTNEANFVASLTDLGFTEHDAYTMWFSP